MPDAGLPVNDFLTWDVASLIAVSFGVGIVIGLTGMGGGALMTPALIFLGIPPSAAVANDLVAAAVNKSVGASVHWRKGSPNFRLAAYLVAGSVPTAFAGAFIVKAIGNQSEQESFLKIAIGCTLLMASSTYAFRMYLELHRGILDTVERADPVIRPLPTFAIGVVGGLLVGITSVGSGSLMMVALLVLYPTLTALKLVGTDLLQAIPLVISAALSHVFVTGVDWMILIPLIIGGSPGTFLGARIANAVSPSVIRRGITMVLALTGLSMLKVPPTAVGFIGVGFVLLGPVGWGWLRTRHGLTPFEHLPIGQHLARESEAVDPDTIQPLERSVE